MKKVWVEKYDDILKEKYPIHGTEIPELLFHFSKSAIYSRANRLNIHKIDYNPDWKKPDKQYHISKKELFNLYVNKKKSMHDIASYYNCSVDTINKRIKEFGINKRSRRDAICIARNFLKHIKINDYIKQVLDGVMISDGSYRCCNMKTGETAYFSIELSIDGKEWIDSLKKLFGKNDIKCSIYLRSRKKEDKEYPQCALQTSSYVEFGKEWKRWYLDGKKIVPKDIQFTLVFLAHWYMGDGTVLKNYNKKLKKYYYGIEFCTDCFTKEDVIFLKNSLKKKYGYNFVISRIRDQFRIRNNNHDEVNDFLFKISPYKIDCYDYKWRPLYDQNSIIVRKFWSKRKKQILRRYYPKHGSNIPLLLNDGLTKSSIKQMARKLGLNYEDFWTDQRKEIIKREYPKHGSNISILLNDGATKSSINQMARKLNIKRKTFWTKERLDILKDNYPKHGTGIPELITNGATKSSIQQMARKLGVKYEGFWSKEEMKVLFEKYPELGTDIPELTNNGRSRESIKSMARDHGIKCKYCFTIHGKFPRTK